MSVLLGLKETLAFKDANLRGATPVKVNIGRHEAYRVENAGGGTGACEVFIATGESSLVQITAVHVTTGDTAATCERAIAVAKIVDPKLP